MTTAGHDSVGAVGRERSEFALELATGPNPGGGYQVLAVFPLDEDATRPGITSSEAATREQLA